MSMFKQYSTPPALIPNTVVGCLVDISIGVIRTGTRGELWIDGGLSGSTVLAGPGNTYKTALSLFLMTSSYATLSLHQKEVSALVYDTETTLNPSRIETFHKKLNLPENLVEDPEKPWSLTNKMDSPVKELIKNVLDSMKNKVKSNKKVEWKSVESKVSKKLLEILPSDLFLLDSLSKLDLNNLADTLIKKDADSSDLNTTFLSDGRVRKIMLETLLTACKQANVKFITTVHLGKSFGIGDNKYEKKMDRMQFLPQSIVMKGAPETVNFSIETSFIVHPSVQMKDPGTKLAKYPRKGEGVENDLNLVTLETIRCKTGASGVRIPVIVSQEEGVLPTLTEFHYIKEAKFGIEGNDRSYCLTLYPDVKLSRTTVRDLIDSDPKLRAAIRYTSEILQIMAARVRLNFVDYFKNFDLAELKKVADEKINFSEDLDKFEWRYGARVYETKFLSTPDLLELHRSGKLPFWVKKTK